MANPLPGLQTINGTSSLIFGSNMSPDYQAVNSRTSPQIQAQIKAAGITLMRCAIPAGSAGYPDVSAVNSYVDQTANACAAMGTQMLVILDFSHGITFCQQVVSRLGNRCNLYEFRNEPDIANPAISWQQYLSDWNTVVPQLKAINPNASFIGPVLGVFDNLQTYLVPWLQGCKSSGVLPSGISFHIYPCTGSYTQTQCSARATSFADAAAKANAAITSVLGYTLPLCLTEWNIDAEMPVHSYATDPAFVPGWTAAAIDSIASAGYAIACQWECGGNAANGADSLVQPSTLKPNPNGQLQAFAAKVQQYLGSGNVTPPPPVPPTSTVDVAAAGQATLDWIAALKKAGVQL